MSYVADVILTTFLEGEGIDEPCKGVVELNEWLDSENYGILQRVDQYTGGRKAQQADIYLGAFNYLDIGAFVEKIKSIKWVDPEYVQLFLKDEDDDLFNIIIKGDDTL